MKNWEVAGFLFLVACFLPATGNRQPATCNLQPATNITYIPMIVTCVHVHVKSDAINEFIRASAENHLAALKEPGNLRFDFVQQADDPCRFMLYEAYETEEASAAHKNTPHYLKWKETVQNMMAEPRKGIKYNILQPEDPSKW